MTALIFVITLLLTFWLISLVWNQKIAQRVFKIAIYLGLIVVLIAGIYLGYQGYRWGSLLHQLNERSMMATALINTPPAQTINQ